MNNTKLYDVLSHLNIYALNRLEKFLNSPYHNEDKRLSQCYTFIKPYFKEKNKTCPTQAAIWKKVYGKVPFNNARYARLLSDIVKKTESFMCIEKLQAVPTEKNLSLLTTYNEYRLDKYFTEPFLFTVKKLEEQPYRDADFFFHRFQLNAQQNIHLENKRQRTSEKNLWETVDSLDAFYLIHKLRYSAAILHYKKFLALEGEMALIREVVEHLQRKSYTHLPAVNIYYHILLTLIEPEKEQHFQMLKQLMLQHQQLFPASTNKEYFAFSINYCIRKINNGQPAYQQEILALYKEALKADLMLDNGWLSPWDYKNITTIALRNKEYKWTDKFIEDYKNYIPNAERQNAYTFNRARYFFAVKKYDRVLQLLQTVEYDDIFYLLDSKTTLMKTYYELREYQPLMSLKESFRILLRRKKTISEQNRINYMNFLRFTMKLYRLENANETKIAEVKKVIESTGNIADKNWILEKLSEHL